MSRLLRLRFFLCAVRILTACALSPEPAILGGRADPVGLVLLDERVRMKERSKKGRGNHHLLFFLRVRACVLMSEF